MEYIYSLIQENPKFYTWAFAVINCLWGIFLYFNKQSHEKKMTELKSSLDLSLEKKKKVFEMKVQQYERYFNLIDSFNHKYSVSINDRLSPIIQDFMQNYLYAADVNNARGMSDAILKMSQETHVIVNEVHKEFMLLEQETNSLRLTASDEILVILDELKSLFDSSINLGTHYLSKFIEILTKNDQNEIKECQDKLHAIARKSKEKSEQLLIQMRKELSIL